MAGPLVGTPGRPLSDSAMASGRISDAPRLIVYPGRYPNSSSGVMLEPIAKNYFVKLEA